jgi:hypothetical protein
VCFSATVQTVVGAIKSALIVPKSCALLIQERFAPLESFDLLTDTNCNQESVDHKSLECKMPSLGPLCNPTSHKMQRSRFVLANPALARTGPAAFHFIVAGKKACFGGSIRAQESRSLVSSVTIIDYIEKCQAGGPHQPSPRIADAEHDLEILQK